MKCEALFTRLPEMDNPMEGPPNPICWMCNNAFIDVSALLNVPQTLDQTVAFVTVTNADRSSFGPKTASYSNLSFAPKDVVPQPVACGGEYVKQGYQDPYIHIRTRADASEVLDSASDRYICINLVPLRCTTWLPACTLFTIL